MSTLAQQIQLQENCGADFAMRNPLVLQAYNGFTAYQPSFHAGCLKDSDGNYCYANAATNSTSPTSGYIYYLPLGVSLPQGTNPTCSRCLRDTMSVFAAYASNSSQPLNAVYNDAAQQVDTSCGNRFVEATIQTTSVAALVSVHFGLALAVLTVLLFQLLL